MFFDHRAEQVVVSHQREGDRVMYGPSPTGGVSGMMLPRALGNPRPPINSGQSQAPIMHNGVDMGPGRMHSLGGFAQVHSSNHVVNSGGMLGQMHQRMGASSPPGAAAAMQQGRKPSTPPGSAERIPVGMLPPPPPPYSPHTPSGGGGRGPIVLNSPHHLAVSSPYGRGSPSPRTPMHPPPAYGSSGGCGGAVAQGISPAMFHQQNRQQHLGPPPQYFPPPPHYYGGQFMLPPPPGPIRLPYWCATIGAGGGSAALTQADLAILDKLPRLEGEKWTYDAASEKWVRTETKVIVESMPFAEGAMRQCHRLFEVDGNHYIVSVAKVFKTHERTKAYMDEAKTQMVAESYAQEYNRLNVPQKVAFLSVSVLKIPSVNGVLAVEPLLPGEYVKHNDNAGHVATDEITPQAFSHYTLQASGGQLLVCDIQGVGEFFTDPQIHCEAGDFGLGNLRSEGIRRFRASHVCNDVCQQLSLTPCNDTADAMLAKKLQDMEFAAAGRGAAPPLVLPGGQSR